MVNVAKAERTLVALGYIVRKPRERNALSARRGQDHIIVSLNTGRVQAHKDLGGSWPVGHRALKGPFTKRLLEEFYKAYKAYEMEVKHASRDPGGLHGDSEEGGAAKDPPVHQGSRAG